MIRTEPVILNCQKRLKIMFNDNSGITTKLIRRIKGCAWSDELHCWHIPYYDNYKEFLNRKYKDTLRFEHLPMKGDQILFNSSDRNEIEAVVQSKNYCAQFVPKRFFE